MGGEGRLGCLRSGLSIIKLLRKSRVSQVSHTSPSEKREMEPPFSHSELRFRRSSIAYGDGAAT
jgi:hypothetical protein